MTLLFSRRCSVLIAAPLLAASLVATSFVATAAPQAHQHGAAKLDVAVEPGKISLQLDTPLDNLLGFERAPRTDAERARADAAVATLKAAATLFKFDAAAGCALLRVTLDSAALKLGSPAPTEAAEGHADIDGTFEFACKDVSKATAIDVGLFDAFKRMQRIESQIAAPQGQFKRTLVRPARRLALTKE